MIIGLIPSLARDPPLIGSFSKLPDVDGDKKPTKELTPMARHPARPQTDEEVSIRSIFLDRSNRLSDFEVGESTTAFSR